MVLKLGISPCPNDTYIFYGLIHNSIDTNGLSFDIIMRDVEELNRLAFENPPDICKLSYHALVHLYDIYDICESGGAMGFGNGPLLVAKKNKENLNDYHTVVLPGEYTTAHFLFKTMFPDYRNDKIFIRYDNIENYLLNDPGAAGVLIHESRFAYKEKGLHLISDLGLAWQNQTGLPVPLGGIGVSKKIPLEIRYSVPRMIRDSIRYAEQHPHEVMIFMKKHAQEMEESIIRKHVKMFVNDYSFQIGSTGKASISLMSERLGLSKRPDFIA